MPLSLKATKRALRYYRIEEYRHALLELNAVIEEQPDYWLGYFGRGQVNAAMGRYLEAIEDFTRVLKQPRLLNKRNRLRLLQNISVYAVKLCDLEKGERLTWATVKPYMLGTPYVKATGRISQLGKFLFDAQDISKLNRLVSGEPASGSAIRILTTYGIRTGLRTRSPVRTPDKSEYPKYLSDFF
jgi:tetratricopeptide (TPR) repeat protein